MKPFASASNFDSLSLKDLLDARNLFHYHLISKPNVIATAVGLYRIRKDSRWPSKENPDTTHTPFHKKDRRTLFNSEIRPYSWPCVYVFVDDWNSQTEVSSEKSANVVPKALWMPDGRSVPVCVIEARKELQEENTGVHFYQNSPTNLFGPGTPILNPNAQGMPRLATAGCIVHDGQKFYALTNNHALGDTGSEIQGFRGNKARAIGTTAKKNITRRLISEVYPDFNYNNQYLQLDIGLIELKDITEWKTDSFSIEGELGNVIDLYDHNFSLNLIGQPVSGHGAVSGLIQGEIHGLFYRYKSIGGYEYLSDFLIGPGTGSDTGKLREKAGENISLNIQHGDSGTLLFLEQPLNSKQPAAKSNKAAPLCYSPIAVLWGKNSFLQDGQNQARPYGMATSLSTVLNLLELDFVRDINYDNDYIWGYIGHYAIASKLAATIALIDNGDLKTFITNNQQFISMPETQLLAKATPGTPKPVVAGKSAFVPLADVPDNVWKGNVNKVPGPDGKNIAGPGVRTSPADNPNHFADIDLPNPDKDNKTLLDYSLEDPKKNLTARVWAGFFADLHPLYDQWNEALRGKKDGNKHWGALPFRIWQIFDEMSGFAAAGDATSFLCAGGIIAHYVGDACQPLHTSYMSDGDPSRVVSDGKGGKQIAGKGVHEGYEADMVNRSANRLLIMNGLLDAVKAQQKKAGEKIAPITSGYEAAVATLHLIKTTIDTIKPADIVSKWEAVGDDAAPNRDTEMWKAFGPRTIEVMARGCRYLAAIWQGAWNGNGGNRIKVNTAITEKDLMKLYLSLNFLKSVNLPDYDALLKIGPAAAPAPPKKKAAAKKKAPAKKKAAKKVAAKKAPVKKAAK